MNGETPGRVFRASRWAGAQAKYAHLRAKFDGNCASCGKPIAAGDPIRFDTARRQALHPRCSSKGTP